jgi:hypothetical protein
LYGDNRNVLAHYTRRVDGTPIKNMATMQIFDVIRQDFNVSGQRTEEQVFFFTKTESVITIMVIRNF